MSAPRGTWGGARNRADIATDCLSDERVAALIDAAAYALAMGWLFQRHWIVHYGKAGVAPDKGRRFVGRLLELVRKQARREGGDLVALWVRERASDIGEHAHILLFVPPGMSLRNRTRRWIAAAGGKCVRGVSKVKVIGGRLPRTNSRAPASHYRENAANVVGYLLKSAEAATGERLALKYSGRGGRIIGKRCGWTENIGAKARTLRGWQSA